MEALRMWTENLGAGIKYYIMRSSCVINFHKAVGIMCGLTLLAIIASQTNLKQACPDNLFYYQECASYWWLNVMIIIIVLLSIVIDLLQMFVLYSTKLDRYIGAALLLANIGAFVLLVLASADTIHFEVVYLYSFILMVLNGWMAFSALFDD
jgi:hypothetical protein